MVVVASVARISTGADDTLVVRLWRLPSPSSFRW